MTNAVSAEISIKRTRAAFLWTNLLGMPFWAIYTLLLFILYKDLHATPLQITLFIILRPLVSIFSLYWSAYVNKRRDRLLGNLIWAGLLGPLPFLFFPVVSNPWYFIFASAIYMTLVRGVFPAWMEILKLNLPEGLRQQSVAFGTTLSYVGGGILSLLIGWLMDDYLEIWRWIFPITALMSMMATTFQLRIPIPESVEKREVVAALPWKEQLLLPWKNVWELLATKQDFRRFHFGYMLGGFGLVVIQPALPIFFIDTLHLSYTELTMAITLCKGIAFALTSPLWAKLLRTVNIFQFCTRVALLAGIFPLLLISAQLHIVWVFVAYLLYGVMQSGSELSWHLSGPIFSKGEDSSSYSSVNLAVVGLRGCIAPLLGGLLVGFISPLAVLLVGACFSLYASSRMYSYNNEYNLKAKAQN
jgi:hypothetical protein